MTNQNQFRVVWHPDRNDEKYDPEFNPCLHFTSDEDYWWFPKAHLVGYSRPSGQCLELEFTSHTMRMSLFKGTDETLIDEILTGKKQLFLDHKWASEPSKNIEIRQVLQHVELAGTKPEYHIAEDVQ